MSEHTLPPGTSYKSDEFPATAKETRQIVTPYAFHVSEALLGQPLASPWRRLFAQAIDLIIVAMLSGANSLILAFLLAMTFFKAGNNLALREGRTATRKLLRLSGALLLFMVTFMAIEAYQQTVQSENRLVEVKGLESRLLNGVNVLAWRQCGNDFDCLQTISESFGEAMAETDTSRKKVEEAVAGLLEMVNVEQEQKDQLRQIYLQAYEQAQSDPVAAETPSTATEQEDEDAPLIIPSSDPDELDEREGEEDSHSLIAWVKGILADLGIGFGWAALYYSVCTAWWRGYTPGKRLMGIKVLKLDGSSLTLWESFGRYGGYGAGLATGLLGFLQVFWDPNRQGIQDKIAETLVLRTSQELSAITHQSQSQSGTEGEGI